MSLPRHLFTPAFRHQHLGRSFAAIVGIMVFIASFAMAAEAILLTASYLWGQTMETRITVEIPAVGDESSMPQAERVKQATSVLRALPGVGLVMPLSDDEVERLLQPWFNNPDLLKALPLPTLIDIERKSGATLSATQIQAALKNVVSDARVDDHGAWTQDIWRLVRGLILLGGLTIALTAVTLIITVSLICRAVMAAEHETISLLHLLGAEDKDIARHFQMQAKCIARNAATLGFLIALAVTAALLFSTRHSADFSALQWNHWLGLSMTSLLIPISATFIAAITARISVMRLIKSFP
jgi:cell division transport system permease protein